MPLPFLWRRINRPSLPVWHQWFTLLQQRSTPMFPLRSAVRGVPSPADMSRACTVPLQTLFKRRWCKRAPLHSEPVCFCPEPLFWFGDQAPSSGRVEGDTAVSRVPRVHSHRDHPGSQATSTGFSELTVAVCLCVNAESHHLPLTGLSVL